MNKNIFISQKIPASAENILKQAGFSVKTNKEDRMLSREELLTGLKKADAAICLLSDKIDAAMLAELPRCKVIANYAVGFNNIDIETAKSKGIIITNTPDVLTDATADLTLALILAAARHIVAGDAFMRGGQFKGWKPFLFLGKQLSTSYVGIVGAGRIGVAVAERVHAFGAKLLYFSNNPNKKMEKRFGAKRVTLNELLENSDIVSLHAPLTPNSRHLLNKNNLTFLKNDAILINTARGELVDEPALIKLLKKRKSMVAGFDVYYGEPNINPELLTLPNVVLSPHTGSATRTAREQMAEIAAINIVNVLNGGKPLTPVW